MAERMAEKEFSRWRDRLAFAKRRWVEEGLIGTQYPSPMRMLIEFYRGNQWEHLGTWAGLTDQDLMVVNKIFPIANTIDGEVAARRPQAQFRARNEDTARMTRPAELLINYDIEEIGWKRQSNRAMRDHLFAPVGLLRHGFTPQEEWDVDQGRNPRRRRLQRFRPAKPDRPWIKREPIWNVLMDPSAAYFHPDEGMRWVAFRSIELLEDVKANPNIVNREGLEELAGNVDPPWAPHGRSGSDDPDQDQYLEIYTVYESVERTWFQMTLDGLDKPLRERDDWPIPWETLPISVFSVNEQMDQALPLSILENVIPTAVELNKLRTIMHRIALTCRRLMVVQKNLDPAEKDKIEHSDLVEMIEADDPATAIENIAVSVFPTDLLAYEAIVQEDLREIAGQSKMGRAQRINVETAHEVERVQQGQDIHTGRIADAFEDFQTDALRLYVQARRATMELTGEEIVPVVGEANANQITEWVRVSPEMLQGDYEVQIQIGSTRRRDRDREAQQRGADLTVALQSGDLLKAAYYARKYVEARGDDPAQAMIPQALTASYVRALDQMLQNARTPEAGGTQAETGGVDANIISALGGGGGLTQ